MKKRIAKKKLKLSKIDRYKNHFICIKCGNLICGAICTHCGSKYASWKERHAYKLRLVKFNIFFMSHKFKQGYMEAFMCRCNKCNARLLAFDELHECFEMFVNFAANRNKEAQE